MVSRTGGYYWANYKGFRGMKEGDQFYPTIFNVVVDAVVRHWTQLVEERVVGQDGRRREG